MDAETLGAAIAIAKAMPGTAAADADRAETAADLAQAYGFFIGFDGDTIVIDTANEEG